LKKLVYIISLLCLLGVAAVTAQDAGVDYAGLSADTLVIVQPDGATISVPNPPGLSGAEALVWSPDGSQLAYTLTDATYDEHIAVTDGTSVAVLANAGTLESGFPLSWTPDGQILFAQSLPPGSMGDTYVTNIALIAPEANAQPVILGSVPFGVGCGGGSPIPSDWQYWEEAGFGGTTLALRWTNYGILYSVMCSGAGLGLFNPQTGESYYLTPVTMQNGMPDPDVNITHAQLSPDGNRLLAIRRVYQEPDPLETLVLIDLATGTITDVPTQMQPEQIAWSASGDVYYAAHTTFDLDLLDNFTPEQLARIYTVWTEGYAIDANVMTIWRLNLQTGAETALFMGEAYYAARLTEAPDGSLWFSLIPNLNVWLQQIGDGTLDLAADVDGSQQRATVAVNVYRVFLEGDWMTQTVATNFNQVTLRPSTP